MARQVAEQQTGVRYRVPAVEIAETPEAVILKAEMPGVAKEDPVKTPQSSTSAHF